MRYVSLFSGAGISDWGFHLAGWDCLAQVEIDKQANNVRKRHFPWAQHFEDIRSFDAKQFRGVDAIIGGFPCQDYSVAGRRAGLVGDRGALWWEFHRCIRETLPQFVVGENVPGILSSDEGRSFRTIVSSLVELGYGVAWRILDLRYFRVPQRRRRVFIVGSLGDGRASEILFEPDCLRGHFAEGGEEGEDTPRDVARCLRASSPDSDPDKDNYIAGTLGGGSGNRGWKTEDGYGAFVPIAGTLAANGGGLTRPAGNCNETDFCVPFSIMPMNSGKDFKARVTDVAQPLMTAPVGGNQGGDYIAFNWQSGGDSRGLDPTPNVSALSCHQTPAVQRGWNVRRLTPRECERLMGMEDDSTRYGADGKEIADGPRYKMLGNGWSVPQAQWIAERIKMNKQEVTP